ncbi:unnamed protein product [Hydatigera taeniaeformis]|uniref:Shootin-1 n=1 Tax=Hydatigena taeniaeformis TaxID=6205 RepID=A0A0R3WRB3_HYDTA|nr:unnamed protein product [Hydatigera taeniaeformis]
MKRRSFTLLIEAITRLEVEAVNRETTLKKVLLKAEKQNVKKAVQDQIARVCKEVRRQANGELEAARERYSQLEAEFRFALYSEGQRYNQLFKRATTAEKALQEQGEELHATRENLNLATALVHSLKKVRTSTIDAKYLIQLPEVWVVDGQQVLRSDARAERSISLVFQRLSTWRLENFFEGWMRICIADLEWNLGGVTVMYPLIGEVSSNNSTLCSELNELTTKLKSAEESVRIKTIQLDDQLDTIKRLKSDLNAERDRSKEMTKVEEQNKKLQSAVDHLTDRKDELKSLLLQVQSENSCLKDEILAHQEEINCIKEGFCCKEGDWLRRCSQAEKERDVAVGKMRKMAEEMKEVERSCQNRLESMEIALNEQEREANQRLLETQAAANQRIHELEQEMRQILLESMALRERVEATMKHLAGELSYQGD